MISMQYRINTIFVLMGQEMDIVRLRNREFWEYPQYAPPLIDGDNYQFGQIADKIIFNYQSAFFSLRSLSNA